MSGRKGEGRALNPGGSDADRPIRIDAAVAAVITQLEDEWVYQTVCPCCGKTWQELIEDGEVQIFLCRSLRRALRRQGRSRGTGRRPARAEAGRSAP